jgi:hypothetical protein
MGLTFAFAGWTSAEEDSIRTYLRWIIPALTERHGDPWLPNLVTIGYQPDLGYSGVYSASANAVLIAYRPEEIGTMFFFSILVHELSHAWRDEAIIWAMCYEEGLARAVEVSVMDDDDIPAFYRSDFWDAGHSYYYDVAENPGNQPEISASSRSFFPILTLRRYQHAGWVFWRLQESSNKTFLREFHQDYFERCRENPELPENLAIVRTLMGYAQPIVDGMAFERWWDWYQIMRTEIAVGDRVYLWPDQIGVTAYSVGEFGAETAYQDVLVEWEVLDRDGQLLASGTVMTAANGNAVPQVWLPYDGKGTARYRIHLPNGVIERSQLYWLAPSMPVSYSGYGLFGVTDGPDGPITATSLDGAVQLTEEVTDGEFVFPELDGVAGAFRIIWNNRICVIRKDVAPYLVVLNEQSTQPVSVSEALPQASHPALFCAPNPFSTETQIRITGPDADTAVVRIYDVTGRLVRRLSGRAVIAWDGTDHHERRLPAGQYILRLDRNALSAKVVIR